jgi:hypothetical protein
MLYATTHPNRPLAEADMSSSRAMMFAASTIALAVSVAWSAPDSPDSPRARLAGWLRAHGHTEMARAIEPTSMTRTDVLPGVPLDLPLPSQVIPPLP